MTANTPLDRKLVEEYQREIENLKMVELR